MPAIIFYREYVYRFMINSNQPSSFIYMLSAYIPFSLYNLMRYDSYFLYIVCISFIQAHIISANIY